MAERLEAELLEHGLDPYSAGNTDDEKLSRAEEADRTLARYTINPDTGQPDPETVTFEDHVRVSALISGVRDLEPELTITQAFAFYLSEKTEPDPYKRRKQEQRFERAQKNLLAISKKDILLTDVTRTHARKLVDGGMDANIVESTHLALSELDARLAEEFLVEAAEYEL